jgi:16S rRNA U516 pseudouridylate synthase RsuA-like enzyme
MPRSRRDFRNREAGDYFRARLLGQPPVKIRFDIVEVLLVEGRVRQVRHLPNTFGLSAPWRYG